jgi:hypothetical protein
MSAADMKAREFQSWSSVAPGWRKSDKRLTRSLHGVSSALLDKGGVALSGVTWIAWGRKVVRTDPLHS